MSLPTKPEIVLLGGSGDVGTCLVRMLLDHTTAVVTTVSRRVSGDADPSDGRLRQVSLDLLGGETLETAAGSNTVNLTEATPPSVAKQVIQVGGWFLYDGSIGNRRQKHE